MARVEWLIRKYNYRVNIEHKITAYDFAIRAWASHEPEAIEIVRRIDRYWYEVRRSLFKEIGFTGDELEMPARIFFVLNSFDLSLSIQESRQQQWKYR